MAAGFVPRTVFAATESLPKSYFLGHHKSGLERMKTLLARIDLVVECRDYRIPLTSRNPLFEEALGNKERAIVYTKHDLVDMSSSAEAQQRANIIRAWHAPTAVVLASKDKDSDIRKILRLMRERAGLTRSLLGARMMVIGMPNVGKSTLINSLRRLGTGGGKAAKTGAQPGVTRKIGTPIKIIEGDDGTQTQSVYLLDTPGVFVPHVPDADAMLKLALCGSVKDALISPVVLADYLLFHMNLNDPQLYSDYSEATNDVEQLLMGVARATGRLQRGGSPDFTAAAVWIVQRWRLGELGRFALDDITDDSLRRDADKSRTQSPSLTSALKSYKSSLSQKRVNG